MPDDVAMPVGRVPAGWAARKRKLAPGAGWLFASRLMLVLTGALTVMTIALAVGMRLDDHQIDTHRGTATATVLSISALRTGIEFVDDAGVTVRPPDGVLYPGLLVLGQRFMIEYSTVDPTVVRVAGRTARVGDLVLGITLIATWVVGFVSVWWLRRMSRIRSGEQPARRTGVATRATR
jgi:hypothetical protein